MIYLYNGVYSTVNKINEFMKFAGKRVEVEKLIQSKITQIRRQISYAFL